MMWVMEGRDGRTHHSSTFLGLRSCGRRTQVKHGTNSPHLPSHTSSICIHSPSQEIAFGKVSRLVAGRRAAVSVTCTGAVPIKKTARIDVEPPKERPCAPACASPWSQSTHLAMTHKRWSLSEVDARPRTFHCGEKRNYRRCCGDRISTLIVVSRVGGWTAWSIDKCSNGDVGTCERSTTTLLC